MNMRNYFSKRALLSGVICAAIAGTIGCSFMNKVGMKVAEDTGPIGKMTRGINEVSDARALDERDENELGKSVAILITNRFPPSDNKKLVQYVNLVGCALVDSSKKPNGEYAFGVLDTDEIGAYSGPHGYVMVTRGAIANMQDEAELAGVLAHELTHVINQHGLEAARVAAQKAGYMDAAKSILDPINATKFIDSSIDAVVRNGYDKPEEDAADAGGVKLMIATGYDPKSYAHFLSHIAAMQEAAPKPTTQSDNSASQQIMASHPGVPERYQAVMKLIADAGNVGGATLRERFIANTR